MIEYLGRLTLPRSSPVAEHQPGRCGHECDLFIPRSSVSPCLARDPRGPSIGEIVTDVEWMRSKIRDNIPLHLRRKQTSPSEPQIVGLSKSAARENALQLFDAIVEPVNVADA